MNVTPGCKTGLDHEVWYVCIEDLHDDQVGIKAFHSHPRNGGKYEELDETGQKPARYWVHLRISSRSVQDKQREERGVQAQHGGAQADENLVCLAAP